MSAHFDDYGDVLTVDEVCELTGWGRRQVYEACREGEMPHARLGRTIRIAKPALMEMFGLEENEPSTNGGPVSVESFPAAANTGEAHVPR